MSIDALFTHLPRSAPSDTRTSDTRTVGFAFEGRHVEAVAGQSLAAALLVAGVRDFRESPVNGRVGAPYCMMGVCFECLLEVDGQANVQSCLTPVRDGMRVRRQRGAREVDRGEHGHD